MSCSAHAMLNRSLPIPWSLVDVRERRPNIFSTNSSTIWTSLPVRNSEKFKKVFQSHFMNKPKYSHIEIYRSTIYKTNEQTNIEIYRSTNSTIYNILEHFADVEVHHKTQVNHWWWSYQSKLQPMPMSFLENHVSALQQNTKCQNSRFTKRWWIFWTWNMSWCKVWFRDCVGRLGQWTISPLDPVRKLNCSVSCASWFVPITESNIVKVKTKGKHIVKDHLISSKFPKWQNLFWRTLIPMSIQNSPDGQVLREYPTTNQLDNKYAAVSWQGQRFPMDSRWNAWVLNGVSYQCHQSVIL